jgi:hypothetical protein
MHAGVELRASVASVANDWNQVSSVGQRADVGVRGVGCSVRRKQHDRHFVDKESNRRRRCEFV